MLNSYFQPRQKSSLTFEVDLLKVLAFEMADYVFALPISLIFKVINCPPITTTSDLNLGLADFEGQTVTVINLAQKLSAQNTTQQLSQKQFLILSKTRYGEICGIPIDKSPVLLEFPKNQIKSLPLSARQSQSLSIATHVVTMTKSKGDGEVKIFLIGT